MCQSLFSCLVELVSVRKRDSRRHVVLMAQFHTSSVKAGDFIAFSFIRSLASWLSHFAAFCLSPLRVNNFTCKKRTNKQIGLCCFVVNNNIDIEIHFPCKRVGSLSKSLIIFIFIFLKSAVART